MDKFPDSKPVAQNGRVPCSREASPNLAKPTPRMNGDRWKPISKKEATHGNSNRWAPSHRPRQKSISDAFYNIRNRSGSVSQNAHEIADALRAPVSPKLVVLCLLWYTSSAMTNTSSKTILNAFPKPATLTLIQFAFVSSLCIAMAWLATVFPNLRRHVTALKHPIRSPSADVIVTTLPLAAFQIGGHLLSSLATSNIPVSLVHTIKGLSPLFTVLAYRIVYDIHYPRNTYLSLIPLTLGVMLACSGKSSYGGQLLGVIEALMATLIFVTQNIFSKTLFNEAAKAEAESGTGQSRKLDKLNLLCYSSGLAFILTMPIWFWSEGIGLLRDFLDDGAFDIKQGPTVMDHTRLIVEFVFNGVFHFAQNILAFVLLSLVSPVTYSVASLIKRVFVIVLAIMWFRSPTTPIQGVGIALTFLGLYLYDRTSDSNKADRKASHLVAHADRSSHLLPLSSIRLAPSLTSPQKPLFTDSHPRPGSPSDDFKKSDDAPGCGPGRANSNAIWLAPGTKQEDTWRSAERPIVT